MVLHKEEIKMSTNNTNLRNTSLTALTGNLSNPSNLPISTKLAIKRECGLAVKDTATAMVREQGRALLANTALQSIGALSVTKDRILELSPGCADECDLITRAYAFAAAQHIAGF
jgi:hypothetical protein